jgi:hypothetical protein
MTKYEQVRSVHDTAVQTHDASGLREIPKILNGCGIRCREDDGRLLSTNLSVPTSVGETITIGLRYEKRDQTLTEDIFEITKNNPNVITSYYKGLYQAKRPEYRGTHKLQNTASESFTSVNSCCLYLGGENGS